MKPDFEAMLQKIERCIFADNDESCNCSKVVEEVFNAGRKAQIEIDAGIAATETKWFKEKNGGTLSLATATLIAKAIKERGLNG